MYIKLYQDCSKEPVKNIAGNVWLISKRPSLLRKEWKKTGAQKKVKPLKRCSDLQKTVYASSKQVEDRETCVCTYVVAFKGFSPGFASSNLRLLRIISWTSNAKRNGTIFLQQLHLSLSVLFVKVNSYFLSTIIIFESKTIL